MKNQGNKEWLFLGIILIILLVIVAIIGINNKKTETTTSSEEVDVILSNAEKESAAVKDSDKKELPEINMDTFLDYYNGEEKKIILLARPTCGYCQIAEPIIQKIAKDYNIEIFYLNTDDFEEDDQQKLINSDEFFKEGYGTPILLLVGEGKIIDKVDGLTDSSHYIEFFHKNGII